MKYLIIFLFSIMGVNGYAQIHVADTVLSEQQGLAFLKWCFTHPDTVYREMTPGTIPSLEGGWMFKMETRENIAKQYNADLVLRSAWIIPYDKGCADFYNCWHMYIIPKVPAEISLRQWIRSHKKPKR